jgi:phosphate transport system substrate-binding protein
MPNVKTVPEILRRILGASRVFASMSARAALLAGPLILGLLQPGSATAAQNEANSDISGAGATFPYPVYAKWADAYKKISGRGLSYQSIGSGGGIKQIAAQAVTFGASDIPLTAKELADFGGLMQWPMVLGSITLAVNIEGIKAGELTLDGPTLAKVFLGEIKTWNDAALKKLNPKVRLPAEAIVIIHRNDGSGTTLNFTNYLSKVSDEWKAKVGFRTSVEWPTGIGTKGCCGIASEVALTKNSIGYVEMGLAKQNKLATIKLVNQNGNVVEPTRETIQAAAATTDWEHGDGFDLIMTNQPGASAWPISAATFILMPKKVPDAVAAQDALKFFAWAYAKGDESAIELDYVPLPANVKQLVISRWREMKGPDEKPLLGDGRR